MDPSNSISYRQLGRLAQLKPFNQNNKRFFGKDITNIDKRLKKNVSIYEKVPVASKVESKVRSRSLYGHKDAISTVTNLDIKDAINDYKQDVIDFMVKLQKQQPQDIQKQVSQKMRQILIDWLIDVHDSFELKEQTLYLALNYLADYSALRQISKQDYQLAGITCLWIASKYEQIYPPRTKNYVEVTADTYTIKDLKNMQGNIIDALGFNLNRTTPLQLLEGMIQSNQNEKSERVSEKSISLCKYAIQTGLFEGLGRKYTPQTLVMAGIAFSENVLKCKIDLKLQSTMKIPKLEIAECLKDICIHLQNSNKYDLTALKRKYGKSKNHQVSKIRLSVNE